jgi:uncharacterized protein YdeI (YjbR/CyaY-like superfamily)
MSNNSEEKEPEAKVPADLCKALAAKPAILALWKDLTPIGRRDFIAWIDTAKQAETRKRRIQTACSMLEDGKRRPCCFSIVPMNVYKVLGADPKAKAGWHVLSPTARRDFIAWIDEAKQPDARKLRIEKACALLAAGKSSPPSRA